LEAFFKNAILSKNIFEDDPETSGNRMAFDENLNFSSFYSIYSKNSIRLFIEFHIENQYSRFLSDMAFNKVDDSSENNVND